MNGGVKPLWATPNHYRPPPHNNKPRRESDGNEDASISSKDSSHSDNKSQKCVSLGVEKPGSVRSKSNSLTSLDIDVTGLSSKYASCKQVLTKSALTNGLMKHKLSRSNGKLSSINVDAITDKLPSITLIKPASSSSSVNKNFDR